MPNQSYQAWCKEICMTNAFSLKLFQQRKQEESEKGHFSQHLLQYNSVLQNKSRLWHYDRWQSTGIAERDLFQQAKDELSSLVARDSLKRNRQVSNQYCLQILCLIDKEKGKAREDSPQTQVPQGGEQQRSYTSVISHCRERGRAKAMASCLPAFQHTMPVSEFEGWFVWDPHSRWQSWLLWPFLCPWLRQALALSYLQQGST